MNHLQDNVPFISLPVVMLISTSRHMLDSFVIPILSDKEAAWDLTTTQYPRMVLNSDLELSVPPVLSFPCSVICLGQLLSNLSQVP